MENKNSIRALSIRQPWAWLIVHEIKDVENRTWKTNFRGRVLIHASKKIDLAAYDNVRYGLPRPEDLETGGIVGVAEIVDCVEKSKSQWFGGPYGFVLTNSRPLPFYPEKGKLYFFKSTYRLQAQDR